jgi:hypothetical protein
MKSKAKKVLITTVTHEVFVVRVNEDRAIRGFCPSCETDVQMLTLDSAAKVAGLNGRKLVDQIAANEVHSIETENGHLLICGKSLKFKRAANH